MIRGVLERNQKDEGVLEEIQTLSLFNINFKRNQKNEGVLEEIQTLSLFNINFKHAVYFFLS